LHEGRAPTLRKPIELRDFAGSEAHEAIEGFNNLSPNEKQSTVDFLLTLRLPKSPSPLRAERRSPSSEAKNCDRNFEARLAA
jgi:hypothetical protein